jgi:hypothetical protein
MSRWQNAAEYAEELDHELEDLAAETRRAPAAKTDAELLQARWHATGLERARELLREVLHAGPPAAADDGAASGGWTFSRDEIHERRPEGERGRVDLSAAAWSLATCMSAISERAYCAGWLGDLEFKLWAEIERTPGVYTGFKLSDVERAALRALSDAAQGWIVFNSEHGETFVPLDDWRTRFDEWARRPQSAAGSADSGGWKFNRDELHDQREKGERLDDAQLRQRFGVDRIVYSGTCLCGHVASDHHGAVVDDQRLADALRISVVPVGGCEFFDCNEGEGLNEAGEIHCVRYVDRGDPDPARHTSWSEANEEARAQSRPGRPQ